MLFPPATLWVKIPLSHKRCYPYPTYSWGRRSQTWLFTNPPICRIHWKMWQVRNMWLNIISQYKFKYADHARNPSPSSPTMPKIKPNILGQSFELTWPGVLPFPILFYWMSPNLVLLKIPPRYLSSQPIPDLLYFIAHSPNPNELP